MENKKSCIPPVIWAQRSHVVYVTFCVPEAKDPAIKIEDRRLTFSSFGGVAEDNYYEICIQLYAPIDIVNSIWFANGRYVEVELQKLLTDTRYWPRLTRDNVKYHWLKIDFAKWMEEEDEIQDDEKMDFTKNFKNTQPKKNISFSLEICEDEEKDDENAGKPELEIDEWKPNEEVSKTTNNR